MVMEFSTYPKRIRARPSNDRMINIDTQRGECECCIVLANICFELQTMWTCAIKKISEMSWSRRERRKMNLASETTYSKFKLIHC